MSFKAYAEFGAKFEDDRIEEEDEIVVFPGRNVAEAIAEILKSRGYDVSAPEHCHEHGWDLNVYVDGKRIWMEVCLIDDYILQVEAMVGLLRRLRGVDMTYYNEFLAQLNEGLQQDARFGPIGWYKLDKHRPIGGPVDDPLKVATWRT